MLRHGETEFGDRGAAIGEQALAELWIDPGLGDDTRAILRNPLLLGEVLQLLDGFRGVQAALVERRLDGVGAPFHGGGALDDGIWIGHLHRSKRHSMPSTNQYFLSFVAGQAALLPVDTTDRRGS